MTINITNDKPKQVLQVKENFKIENEIKTYEKF